MTRAVMIESAAGFGVRSAGDVSGRRCCDAQTTGGCGASSGRVAGDVLGRSGVSTAGAYSVYRLSLQGTATTQGTLGTASC